MSKLVLHLLVLAVLTGPSLAATADTTTSCAPPAPLEYGVVSTATAGVYRFLDPAPGAPFVAVALRGTGASPRLECFPGGSQSCPGPRQKLTLEATDHAAILVGVPAATGPQYRPDFVPLVSGQIQGDDGRARLVANGCPVQGSGADLVHLWAVRVEAGGNYHFALQQSGTGSRMLLLDPLASPGAPLDRFDAIENASSILYTSLVTRDLALLVLNDDGGAGAYTLSVEACLAPFPAPLDSGAAITSVGREAKGFFRLDPAADGWGALAVQGNGWTTTLFASGTGSACPYGPMGSVAGGAGKLEVLAGRFGGTGLPIQGYFPVATRTADCDTSAAGLIEWAPAGGVLPVAGFVERTLRRKQLVESWTATLEGGRAYGIVFERRDTADLKLLVFSPETAPGASWLTRSEATLEVTHSVDLVAPGEYPKSWGFVVVNDNGKPGRYLLGIYPGGLDAGPAALPARTELRGVFPNPVRDALRLEYALRARARVRLELLDLAGRRVAVLEDGERDPGVWSVGWRPGAAALRPGLYLMRFQVDGRTLGRRKVTVLE